jgi:hypothetical protein
MPAMTMDRPPNVLEIFRDSVKPGREGEYRAAEEDAARACAEFHYPHAHLALESLSGSREVWWLNGFDSEAEREEVTRAYEKNAPVVQALTDVSRRRKDLVGTPVDVLARHRQDLGGGGAWRVAGARFFVASVTREKPRLAGAVFEAPDGTRYVLRPARTAAEAERLAAEAGSAAAVFAVRPYWGLPAREWIAADPEFWAASPAARKK